MAQKAEQIGHEPFPVPPKAKRFAKRQLAKKQRRAAKRNPQEAPKQTRYDGWYW